MKKLDINTVFTIISFIVIAVISHTRLVGKVDTSRAEIIGKFNVLEATNKLDHDYIKQEMKELKLAVGQGYIEGYADVDPKPLVKRKKAYAGTFGGYVYGEN